MCSGFAFNTTKIKIGKKASAPSSLWRCLNRPKERADGKPGRGRNDSQPDHDRSWKTQKEVFRTEYDLATVEYTDELIPRGFVMVDLQQF